MWRVAVAMWGPPAATGVVTMAATAGLPIGALRRWVLRRPVRQQPVPTITASRNRVATIPIRLATKPEQRGLPDYIDRLSGQPTASPGSAGGCLFSKHV